jgi:ABC-type spermidine/putrescine transport system permease subunit II
VSALLRPAGAALAVLFLGGVVLFMVSPVLVGASVSLTAGEFLAFPPEGASLRWYAAILQDPRWRLAFGNSLAIGLICAGVATVIGTLTAYGIALVASDALRRALVVLFILPLAVPHMSLAMALYPVFARLGLIGTWLGVALAQALFALPLVVLAVLSVLRRRDLQLERAARTLGAGPLASFRLVLLPLLAPGIVVGAVLAFMTSFDDVTAPIFLSGATAGTVPKAMLDALALSSDPSVMAASTVIAVVGLGLFAVGSALGRIADARRQRRTEAA